MEYIGANSWDRVRAFESMLDYLSPGIGRMLVGEISAGPCVVAFCAESVPRKVIGNRDYSRSNGKGSRGVYVNYVLAENILYFVRSPVSWKRVDEYFCAVDTQGSIYRLSAEEAKEWLSAI